MKKATYWLVAIVVIVIVIVLVSKPSKQGNAEKIRIGIIAPLTGTAASYGVEGANSVKLALDEINAAGGIAGRQVEYFTEDGKCDAPTAVSAWNKLVSVNKVQAVFGGHCSSETLTIAPLTIRDHVPAFAVFTTSPKVANEGEWLFRHISTNEYYGTILAEQAYKKGYRNIAVLTEVKDFPVTYADSFIPAFKALGGMVTLDERFDPATKDYRTVVSKLRGVKYDAVFISSQGSDVMGLVTNQVKALGLEKDYLYNHAFAPVPFLKASNGYMPKNFLAVTAFTDANSAKVKEFNDKYTKKYGNMYTFSPFYVTGDYDMVYRYKNAAEACAQDDVNGSFTTDCVRKQFQDATSYSGVAGDVTMSSKYSSHGILTPVGLIRVDANNNQYFEAIK